MAVESLVELLAAARKLAPDVPADKWAQMVAALTRAGAGSLVRIPDQRKATHLAKLEAATAADERIGNQQLAQVLGVSVRQVLRIKKLRAG